ncbi:OstA-like protein [Aureibaculum sp. 2210JD6-5]|uniref:OstA-like protein n=1 Tax=Aureibaculum sp. 2210JD6-5 TaxID=3103957 RepID=UPI002AAE6E04|nr:OstA-like protein [Aureibaculum sp. 2210JD6-5]MDY7395560.1 OstA-like protein [Aureibaculum sp. 2210JD6-5]
MKYFLLLIVFITSFTLQAQQKRIQILHADNSIEDQDKYPNQTILLGDVVIEHEGITLRSKKAVHYKLENLIRAYGNVVLNQGDTITQTSDYVQYDGKTKKAKSWGKVVLTDPVMVLTTDTLDFDRVKQLLFYKSGATIKDTANVLVSEKGNYFLKTSKFQALSDVVLTNPDYVLESDHLDYFTNNGQAFLYGPSTITGEDNHIYTENGFYDTQKDISHFTKNSVITYKNRSITADSLYYDRNLAFASATNNIKMLDTLNNAVVRGNYGEFYQKLDSAFVINRAVAITEIEKDSMYVHGDTLLVTGKPENRIVRAYNRVKFFKSNLSGKCDSIHSNQKTGLTQLFRNPVLWSQESQMTGDTIHLLSNPETEKMDSLKILRNAFVIQKDSAGYNQIKGRNILGKFIENELEDVNVIGNSESIFYARNDEDELLGIDKSTCSRINFKIKDKKIRNVTYFIDPEGSLFPPSKLSENERKFPGFIWRDDERPYKMEDIFIKDSENKVDTKDKQSLDVEKNIKKVVE